jgi:hypothetical protein
MISTHQTDREKLNRQVGTPDAYRKNMTLAVQANDSKLMRRIVYLLALAAVALATSFTRGEDQPIQGTADGSVQVKKVVGAAEYAYDSAAWRPLTAGTFLHGGASIRTGNSGSVVLEMEERGSLVRVGPMRRVEFAAVTPDDDSSITVVPMRARARKAANATALAAQ